MKVKEVFGILKMASLYVKSYGGLKPIQTCYTLANFDTIRENWFEAVFQIIYVYYKIINKQHTITT